MDTSSTPEISGLAQAGSQGSGDGAGANGNDGGQSNFSMDIIPETSVSPKKTDKEPDGKSLENGKAESAAKITNEEAKGQRIEQKGWQGIVEGLTKMNERLDKMEQKETAPKEDGEKGGKAVAQDNEAMSKLAESLAETNARLERIDFETSSENADLKSKELSPLWKKVNSDAKFKDFSLEERADYVRGKSGKSHADTMRDQLQRAEGSMPRGSGGGGSVKGGNPNVTEEDVAVGAAFGFTRADLESEL